MLVLRGCRSIVLTALVALAPACDGDDKPDANRAQAKDAKTNDAKAKTNDAKVCDDARGKAIEAEILAGCSVGAKVLKLAAPMAPWKTEPSAPPPGALILRLSKTGTVVDWGRPLPIEQVAQRLTEAMKRQATMAEITGDKTPGWALTIASDVPRADIAAVMELLANAGHPSGHLMLATEAVGDLPAPRDPELLATMYAKVGTLEPDQRATLLAKEIEKKMPKCDGVGKTFRAVSTAAPEQRCPLLALGISEGLVACDCPEADELLTLLYAISVDTQVPEQLSVALPVTLDPKAAPRVGGTWGQMVARLDQGALAGLWVTPG